MVTENLMFVVLRLNCGGTSSSKLILMSNSVSGLRRPRRPIRQRLLLINAARLDAEVDARDYVNTHGFDIWCVYESSTTFDTAVGLGTSISDVQLPPPE